MFDWLENTGDNKRPVKPKIILSIIIGVILMAIWNLLTN